MVAELRTELHSELVDGLLGQPTPQSQADFLRDAGCLNPAGLDELLERATQLMGTDPGQARALAAVCEALAPQAGADAIVPGAIYLRARAHAIDANFEAALTLIESARAGYVARDNLFEAVRTNVGRMFVLQEVGRYADALEAAEAVRDYLRRQGTLDPAHASEEVNGMAARVSQNQGLCYELMGKYVEALDAYADAEVRFRLLDMTESLSDIDNNRGIVLLRLGRSHDALAAFQAALNVREKYQLTLKCAQSWNNIGNANLLLGNYARALAAFERARQSLAPLAAQSEKHIVLLDLAEAYLSLNLYDEALPAYREADTLLEVSGMQHDRARAQWGMGSALMAQGQLDEAARVLASSAALFAAAGNTPMHALVLMKQAELHAALGDRAAALAQAQEALDRLSDGSWALQQAYAHVQLADLLLPDVERVQSHLDASRVLVEQLDLPSLRQLLNQRQGHVYLMTGQLPEAERLLQAAADDVEQLRANVTQDRLRVSFAADKMAAYDDLVQLYLTRGAEGDGARAFIQAERAKARGLLTLLNKTAQAQPAAKQAQAMQFAQRDTLQAELNATYTELLGGAEAGPRRRSLPDLQARAIELEREIGRIQLQIGAMAAPNEDALDQPMPLEAICAQLQPDTALVSYYICHETIFAFVVTSDGVRTVTPDASIEGIATTATVAPLLQRLGAQWERFRAGRAFAERHAAQLEQSTRRLLAALYDALFKPIAPLIESASRLIVVPHGLLHQVPFHALHDGTRYLVERFTMSYAPSASVQAICQRRESPSTGQALVVAVADDLIPSATIEAQSVANLLGSVTMLLNEDATLAALREQVTGCDLVHLACHGLFRAGNPMFSSLKLSDGWLLALDALALDVCGALVTLSACESGRSQTLSGDEIVGLMRAFLGAGAASLVVSLWLVQDDTTADLMQIWYGHMCQGMGRAEALQAAQLALKSRFGHPYYWAPFMLVGHR